MRKRQTAYLIAGIFLMLAIFLFIRFWMLQHAENLIRQLVNTQTQGMYDLQIQQLHLDNNLHVIRLKQVTLKAYDQHHSHPRFILQIPYIYLSIQRIPALILNRALYIDSIYCQSPSLHIGLKAFAASDSSLSLAAQMDEIYLQIQKILNLLQIEKMHIAQGELIFSAYPDHPDSAATRIQKIGLQIRHFRIDSAIIKQQQKRKLLSNQVIFHLGSQTIFLNHQQEKISFDDFYLSTIDSACHIHNLSFYARAKDKAISNYDFSADELYFKKNQFNELYFNKTFQSDSLMIRHARVELQVNLNISPHPKIKDTSRLLEAVLSRIADRASVHHVVIEDAEVKVHAGTASTQYVFQTGKQQLNLHEVVFDSRSENPFSIQQASLNMQHYTFQSSDSSWRFSLQQMILHQDTLVLVQPNLHHQNLQAGSQFHLLASRILIPDLDLNRLISRQGSGAHEIVFDQPEIHVFRKTAILAGKQMHFIPKKFIRSFSLLQGIRIIYLHDGTIDWLTPAHNLQASHVNGNIGFPFTLWPPASSPVHLQMDSMNFKLNQNQMQKAANGYAKNVTIDNQQFRAGEFQIQRSHDLFSCEECNITFDTPAYDSSFATREHNWLIASSGWKSANIQIHPGDTSSGLFPSFLISHLSGENTVFHLKADRTQSREILLDCTHIRLDSFYHDQHQWILHDFLIAGNQGKITTHNLHIQFQNFNWQRDTASLIHNMHIRSLQDSLLEINIPVVSWKYESDSTGDVQALFRHFRYLELDSPDFAVRQQTLNHPLFQLRSRINPAHSMQMDSVYIHHGMVAFMQYDSVQAGLPNLQIRFLIDGWISKLRIKGDSSENEISLQHLYTNLQHLQMQSYHRSDVQSMRQMKANVELMQLSASNFAYQPSTHHWQAFIDSCAFHELNINDDMHQMNSSGKLYAFHLSNRHAGSFMDHVIASSPHQKLHLYNIAYQNPKLIFQGWNATYQADRQLLEIDSVHIHPVKSREDFIKQLQTQKDYVQFYSHQWKLQHFELLSWVRDRVIVADTFDVYHPMVYVYRDKRFPLDVQQNKPMPSEVPDRLPFKLNIDQWNIHQGFASYTEISAQTGQPGTIWFNDIDAHISPVVSDIHQHTADTANAYLQIFATGRLMNQPLISLNYLESRYAPLHLFTLHVQSSPFAFNLFNPILESWFHARVISGNITSASMQAKGNVYMMLGNMNLYYDQLKISLDREKDSTGKKLYSGLENFMANLVLRSENYHRTGLVFYRRNPHLSFFNYWVKGVESGIGSSIMGNKWNRAYRHHYQKLIREHPAYKQGL
ncbi:hypothetical protein [Thermoflavifilum thermophilum]|uniref:Uncharacterized protein n=1 Tax=Thermoflavifilum thermophilum TaxID=1393122 RepID=A0A1I7NEM7_9BACT|nr:hypothetical protein [Thermoflavifilum thermophilum]SFV33124.1 hypothetical protein SAMN05660895_1565 [Thermoflavifilum thermophilum]